ncbi:MAG: LysM peptidoglycan-binding domain-containing protein [Chloroflexi bacterium]|nr:LysM peptidoglycan-binding domain-containing protein [Chloroflexota bacterium]
MKNVLADLTPDDTSMTVGGLKPAEICEVDLFPPHQRHGAPIACMFNPFEYTVSKSNSFKEEKAASGKNSPPAELSQAGAQTLKLNLTFDTYAKGKDVSLETNKLWKLMQVTEKYKKGSKDKSSPPLVVFEWGVFSFVAFITNMTQKFTLFNKDGMPLRAQVDVTFTQYVDVNDYPKQNPTSGDGPLNRTWRVVAGDRLDLIAAKVYKDATKWRTIAEYNKLRHPLDLYPGQTLLIPFE